MRVCVCVLPWSEEFGAYMDTDLLLLCARKKACNLSSELKLHHRKQPSHLSQLDSFHRDNMIRYKPCYNTVYIDNKRSVNPEARVETVLPRAVLASQYGKSYTIWYKRHHISPRNQ